MQKKRILLVDDSEVVLRYLHDIFVNEYDIVTAQSGEDAVAILEETMSGDICFSNAFDLIITDLLMPGMSGFDLAQYVRQRNKVNKYTPVILLTSEKISMEKARESGCAAYFSKADQKRLVSFVRILISV